MGIEGEMDEEIEVRAQNVANALGITVVVRDGRIYQGGTGKRFEPRPGAGVNKDAHGYTSPTEADPGRTSAASYRCPAADALDVRTNGESFDRDHASS